MSIKTWSNVQVAIQSALGTALTVSAISKASPGVVTYTGTDPSNGDYHLLEVQGMTQINNRVVRVANVNGGSNTYEAEGINTLFGIPDPNFVHMFTEAEARGWSVVAPDRKSVV